MNLSKRLLTVAKQLVQVACIADIGTDHGYIPIYLVENGIAPHVIACDVHLEPLKKAEANITAHGLQEKIELRLGSGFSSIKPKEIQGAVISGMGGMLMIQLLEEAKDVLKYVEQMVLQPQLDIPAVRRFLHGFGFRIDKEEMVEEEGKYYTILRAVPGLESYPKVEDYEIGHLLIEKRSCILKKYLTQKLDKEQEIMNKLALSHTRSAIDRQAILLEQMKLEEGVLRWL